MAAPEIAFADTAAADIAAAKTASTESPAKQAITSDTAIRYCEQTWRQLDEQFLTPHFNPPLEVLRRNSSKIAIVFFHVGKCAGESIIRAIADAFDAMVATFEYHSFDANLLIRDFLTAKKIFADNQELIIIIATRDPVERWFSAFNWDLHDLFLSKNVPLCEGYVRYPKASDLAEGISSGDPNALEFGRSNHMGMGLSWYLSLSMVPHLQGHRIYEIRQESADEDFERFVTDFCTYTGFGRHRIRELLRLRKATRSPFPRSKDKYKNAYPLNTFAATQDCDSKTLGYLRDFLVQDYLVSKELRKLLTRRQSKHWR